jgi:hypothetical protein
MLGELAAAGGPLKRFLHDWCYQADRKASINYKANVRAFLGRFVKGDEIDNDDFMKSWKDDVFEFRVQMEPRHKRHPDNTRIFGAFIKQDIFVAFSPARLRSSFKDEADWDRVIDRVTSRWACLFGATPRVRARPFSNCVSSGFHDFFF